MKANRRDRKLWWGLGLGAGVVTGAHFLRRWVAEHRLPPLFKPRASAGVALITGASSGIGATYAEYLAQAGYDLILVARRRERLEALAESLRTRTGIMIEVLPADLSVPEDVARVAERIEGLPALDFLINNAGYGRGGDFSASDVDAQLDMAHVHLDAPLRLTRAALPGMLARGRGAVVNVASLIAFYPLPGSATYSATKDALVTFTRSLHQELLGSGVRVQALCPGFVRTEFHQTADMAITQVPRFAWLSADQVVSHSLRDLAADAVISVPGLGYAALAGISGLLPPIVFDGVGKAYQALRRPKAEEGGFGGFSRRKYESVGQAVGEMRVIAQRGAQVRQAMRLLEPSFRERLMLTVTQVNGCRYCAQAHARMALEGGLSQEEIEDLLSGVTDACPADEMKALLYAQHWAESGGAPSEAARATLLECYGAERTEAIEMILRMIQVGNLSGNTFDYFLYRLSGGRWGQ